MIRGSLSFRGAEVTQNFIVVTLFFTVLLILAQMGEENVLFLDIVQSIICWPASIEAIIITSMLWLMRNTERILGLQSFIIFIIYSSIAYIPVYIILVLTQGISKHPSLIYGYPFAIFIFTFWRIPSLKISGFITDKILVDVAFISILYIGFPSSIGGLLSGIIANILWSYDAFCLSKLIHVKIPESDIVDIPVPEEPGLESPLVDDQAVNIV